MSSGPTIPIPMPATECDTPLADLIREKILREGLLSFRDFMELCLYHPTLGYYCSPDNKIGKGGDFYTSPCFSSLFGEMLARQMEQMWLLLGKGAFTIVEYGAGTGLLCRDILRALQGNKELYRDLQYRIIEKSPSMREQEKRLLPEKVTWHESIGEIGPFSGCILSNELIDNFAVHRVVMKEDLMEVFVGYEEGFTERLQPAGCELKDHLSASGLNLPRGYHLPYGHLMEINLQARDWIREISSALHRGFVLTIDYGYSIAALTDGRRSSGTLACYYRQQRNFSFYARIGRQDMTAHIDFSALRRWGLENGLACCGITGQANFLRAMGLADHVKGLETTATRGLSDGNGQATLLVNILLRDMGNKFKVLIQQKGLNGPRLSGLMFPEYLP
ncbi:MAG: SAM-dependent methyltransferase [Bacteroidota bacterium]|nr:SAM-dependent methyltransferase [Bacteroidota bacterium]